jgi:hypothetical protein
MTEEELMVAFDDLNKESFQNGLAYPEHGTMDKRNISSNEPLSSSLYSFSHNSRMRRPLKTAMNFMIIRAKVPTLPPCSARTKMRHMTARMSLTKKVGKLHSQNLRRNIKF